MSLRVLQFGATGQMAREVIARAGPGVRVTALARADVDLSDARAVAAAVERARPDAVINAAAYNTVDAAETNPDAAFAINAAAPEAMAQACAQIGAGLVHVSTDYVFDGAHERPYTEDDAPNPQSVYGRSKLAGEERVRAAHPGSVIVRTAWVFSRHRGNFARLILDRAVSGGALKGVTDQWSSPTWAGHLADAALALAHRAAALTGDGGVVHVAGRGATSRHAYMTAVLAAAGVSTPVAPVTADAFTNAAQRPRYSALDTTKASEVYGLEIHPWEHGVRAAGFDRIEASA